MLQGKEALLDEKKALQDEKETLKDEKNTMAAQEVYALSKCETAKRNNDDEAAKLWMNLASSLQKRFAAVQGEMEHFENCLVIKKEQLAHLRRAELASRPQQIEWKYDRDAGRMAAELVNIEPEKLRSGIEVTRLTGFIDLDGVRSPTLITRRHTRLLSNAAVEYLEHSPPLSRVAIIGGPGIGKTRTLLHVLRLLLKKGKYVVYAYRTKVFTKFRVELR